MRIISSPPRRSHDRWHLPATAAVPQESRMNQSSRRALGKSALIGVSVLLAGVTSAPLAAQSGHALGVDTTNFDRSVRPQDDFFRFVNGGWLARKEIPADAS